MYYALLICGLRIFNPGWDFSISDVLLIVSLRHHAQLLAVQGVQLLPAHHVHVREPTVRHHLGQAADPRSGQRGGNGGHRVNRGRHFEVIVFERARLWGGQRRIFFVKSPGICSSRSR